jgi:hypothetical protein
MDPVKARFLKYILLASTAAYAYKIVGPVIMDKVMPPEPLDCEELWSCLKEGKECTDLKEKYKKCYK